jgi:hypothetical protein
LVILSIASPTAPGPQLNEVTHFIGIA